MFSAFTARLFCWSLLLKALKRIFWRNSQTLGIFLRHTNYDENVAHWDSDLFVTINHVNILKKEDQSFQYGFRSGMRKRFVWGLTKKIMNFLVSSLKVNPLLLFEWIIRCVDVIKQVRSLWVPHGLLHNWWLNMTKGNQMSLFEFILQKLLDLLIRKHRNSVIYRYLYRHQKE